MQNSCSRVQDVSTNCGRCSVANHSVTMQVQEKLDKLAQEATANAMNVIKSEKYVFTNNDGYMKLLNKMKEYVMRKQDGSSDADAYARDAQDEVHE